MSLGKLAREGLEQELLLSKGGGIYYDDARVDASETEATLFIGLGGTGADMLIRIKNEVKRRMVLPQAEGKLVSDTPNNIGFLALDTDKASMKKSWGTATFDQFGAEFCSIAVADKQAIVTKWKTLAESNKIEAEWYDRIDAEAALPGAGGKRQIGRLLLFENIRSVKDRIEQKVRSIKAGGINNVTVVVVAGIAGGTGSGTFIDIAYIARGVLEDLATPGRNIFGYIVMPDVNLLNGGNVDVLKRNAFAALKELDYWTTPGKYEQDDQFAQEYGGGVSVRGIASRPFDFCHLLSAQDMNGKDITYDKVISSMAENVFAYIAGEVGATSDTSGNSTMSSLYDNINEYIDSLYPKVPIPACYRYLAVGSHKLEIPYEEISTLLAIRLFERLKPTLDLRPVEETFKFDMRNLQLVPKEVIHDSLTRDVHASPLDGNPNYAYEHIWKGENNGPKSNRAFGDVYQWIAREYQVAVTRNVNNWANVQNGIFRNFVASNMKKPDRGPQYLTALIKSDNEWSIIPTLTRMAEQCDNIAATCLSQQGEIDARMFSSYNAGHGKMLNKQKYIAEYLSALAEWMHNENAIYVYPQRAEAIRAFRDRLQVYYDKVFSKLSDVLEALPDIFRQNYEHISIAQREAEREGMLDDTKLIWPLKYEQENRADFDKRLGEGIIGFLDAMTSDLEKWTGCDLDSLEVNPAGADVPGFISRFVSKQFGGLLNINMQEIMSTKEGTDNLEKYLHRTLLDIKEKSVPMFSMRQTYRNTSTDDFGLISVPADCAEIKNAAEKYIKSGNKVLVKASKEKTRLYFVKVESGIPLYAYSKIEDMEKVYESAKQTKITKDGVHLYGKWWDDFPTPLPEASWTPTVYENPAVKAYNASVREAFDFCIENNVIRPDREGGPTKLVLYIADPEKADASKLVFGEDMSLEEQLAALRDERDSLWGNDFVELMGMGVVDREGYAKNVRESVLRLPRLANEIKRQAGIAKAFAQREKEIEDPRHFAFALICGLVTKQGIKIILKNSIDSVGSDMLYSTKQEKPFGEYEAYQAFREKLDNKRRADISQIFDELFDRVSESDSVKETVLERAKEIAETYSAKLPQAKRRIANAATDKRQTLEEIHAFYSTVLKIAEYYRDELA